MGEYNCEKKSIDSIYIADNAIQKKVPFRNHSIVINVSYYTSGNSISKHEWRKNFHLPLSKQFNKNDCINKLLSNLFT